MNYLRFFSLALILTLSGCGEHDQHPFCDVKSVDDLPWLKSEMEANGYFKPSTLMDISIYHAYYQGKEVLYSVICCPACSILPPEIRDCTGESLGRLVLDIPSEQLINQTVIWRSINQVCK